MSRASFVGHVTTAVLDACPDAVIRWKNDGVRACISAEFSVVRGQRLAGHDDRKCYAHARVWDDEEIALMEQTPGWVDGMSAGIGHELDRAGR